MSEVISIDAPIRRPVGAWSDRERHELQRFRALLEPHFPSLDWSAGVTDSGDPWSVAIDLATDDLVAHVARIEGEYVLLDGALAVVAQGRALRPLINRFLSQTRNDDTESAAQSRTVRLHPSVLPSVLAAILVEWLKEAMAGSHPQIGSVDEHTRGVAVAAVAEQDAIDQPEFGIVENQVSLKASAKAHSSRLGEAGVNAAPHAQRDILHSTTSSVGSLAGAAAASMLKLAAILAVVDNAATISFAGTNTSSEENDEERSGAHEIVHTDHTHNVVENLEAQPNDKGQNAPSAPPESDPVEVAVSFQQTYSAQDSYVATVTALNAPVVALGQTPFSDLAFFDPTSAFDAPTVSGTDHSQTKLAALSCEEDIQGISESCVHQLTQDFGEDKADLLAVSEWTPDAFHGDPDTEYLYDDLSWVAEDAFWEPEEDWALWSFDFDAADHDTAVYAADSSHEQELWSDAAFDWSFDGFEFWSANEYESWEDDYELQYSNVWDEQFDAEDSLGLVTPFDADARMGYDADYSYDDHFDFMA